MHPHHSIDFDYVETDLLISEEPHDRPSAVDVAANHASKRKRRRICCTLGLSLAILIFINVRTNTFSQAAHSSKSANSLEFSEVAGPYVVPVRIFLFRHGFTCSNAGHTGACMDKKAPMLNLSKREQEALFDKLDSIGTLLPAPFVIPPIDRTAGIEGRGKRYQGGSPPRPESYRGDDCMLHLRPWTDKPKRQWHEDGDVIQMRHFYRDSLLTECSTFQSRKAGKVFRSWLKQEGIKLNFLLASMLSRTFQTAYYQLLDKEETKNIFSPEMIERDRGPLVSQVPFVNEFNTLWGYQADDVAWPHEEQRRHLAQALGDDAVQHLDDGFLQGFTEDERMGHDWKLFKERVLGQRVLPFILERRRDSLPVSTSKHPHARIGDSFKRDEWGHAARSAAGPSGRVQPIVNIGMASHSGVIQEVCRFKSRSTSNNAVVEMLLLVEFNSDGTEAIVRQESGTCAMVMDAPKPPHELDRRDVENCIQSFDYTQAFTGVAKAKRTPCEDVALTPHAYPTYSAAQFN